MSDTQATTTEDQRFRLVVEAAPNGILMAAADGRIVLCNREAEKLFGYQREEFLQLNIDALVPERFRGRHPDLRSKFQADPQARTMGHGRDLFAVRKDNSEFAVEIGLTPIPTQGGAPLVLCIIVDITERKEAETALREYASQLEENNGELLRNAAILNSVHDAVFLVREDGTIQTWNAGAEKVYGFSADQALGADVRIILPPEDPDRFLSRVLPSVRRDGVYEFTDHSLHHSGSKISVAVRASLLPKDAASAFPEAPDHVIICANDITAQERLQNEILEVSEREQRRIGQDIHDDLCQQIAAISCLAQVLEQQAKSTAPDLAQGINTLGEHLAQANRRAGEIARNLVPAILEADGLAIALEDLAQRTRNLFGAACSIDCPSSDIGSDLSPAISVQLYRIAQEAISNAVRHSDAETIRVSLQSPERHQLALIIADDGRGIALSETIAGEHRGLGLLTMARRAETIGADLDIFSEPGDGTRVTCSLQLSQCETESHA